MEGEGIDSKGDAPSNRVMLLLGLLMMLWKCLLWASTLSMSKLHTFVPVFYIGIPMLSVPFSLTYDNKTFWIFNMIATHNIVNIIFMLCDVINLATEFLNFLRFDQSVFEFDFLDLRKNLSRSLILHFISCYPW